MQGCSLSPEIVHWIITASPKNDSLASLRASFGTLLSHISFGFLSVTTFAETSLVRSIADDGRYFPFRLVWSSAPRFCALSGRNGRRYEGDCVDDECGCMESGGQWMEWWRGAVDTVMAAERGGTVMVVGYRPEDHHQKKSRQMNCQNCSHPSY